MATLGPGQPIHLPALHARAIANGWKTFAHDPRMALACALLRAASNGEVARAGHKNYYARHDQPAGPGRPAGIRNGRARRAAVH